MEVRNMAEPISARQVERILREVSRDFAGAHVNADVVIDAVRRALRAGVIWPSGNGPAKATPSREEIDAGLSPPGDTRAPNSLSGASRGLRRVAGSGAWSAWQTKRRSAAPEQHEDRWIDVARREDFDNSLWSDPDFLVLSSDARLVYIWTWTNPRCGMAGIYKFAPSQAAAETGLPERG
jgi:hypothetical protein